MTGEIPIPDPLRLPRIGTYGQMPEIRRGNEQTDPANRVFFTVLFIDYDWVAR